ncbi:E1 ubiquitin-activating protein UBA2 [Sugiyamaella lignohabitans]|uniref:Ubiquitin-activating enzyme E1-like n=1 Tax=Sugiyamaella lignohabitans TaxID=796027 RepID=A0A167C8D8_9ASCO|nr:E1 ubiquitin-activating protein UBA2 [Sugiyamaella lignohabitans]ANB11350.1 E1 ubiquitin-activating protein UBA2 [Sugiyamaella lignohabitans]
MDKEYGVKWFKSFDIVYNALDNVEARRHVNKLCLVADVPLIESGTAGFNGQVQVIIPGKTECYDCQPKPVPKTFAVCTIRSTPSQPIHCIVWAKSYLFSQLFDQDCEENEQDGDEDAAAASGEDKEELIKLKKERNELKNLQESILDDDFGKKMFDKVFGADIQRLLSMETMWKTRKAPIPLSYEDLTQQVQDAKIDDSVLKKDQKVWSLAENFYVLNHSLKRLQDRLKQQKKDFPDQSASLSFDKDDIDTLEFVAAAANIRSFIFSIQLKSEFDVKQIAGNIIPAIATTNAIVAGICVLQSLLVLEDKLDDARNVFLSRLPTYLVQSVKLQPPNPECAVSGVARTVIKTDPTKLTLGALIDSLLKVDLGYSDEVSVVTDQLLFDPDYDDNINKTLANLKITDGSFLTVIDEEDDGKVNLELYIDGDSSIGDKPYVLSEKPVIGRKPAKEAEPEEDEILLEGAEPTLKRKLSEDADTGNPDTKKARVSETEMDDLIIIDDDDDDAIEIID